MRSVFVFCFLLAPLALFAQDPTYSQIEEMLDSPIDTVVIDGYNELCWYYKYSNPDSALYFGKKAIIASDEIKNDYGMAKAYNNIGIVYWGKGSYDSALMYINKAKEGFEKINLERGVLSALVNTGLLKQNLGKIPESVDDLLKALKMQEKLKLDAYRAPIIANLGNNYYYMEDYNNAKKYFLESYRLKLSTTSASNVYGTEMNLGVAYQKLGDADSAMYFYKKALPTAIAEKAWVTMHELNVNIGTIYAESEEYPKALEYYLEAERLLDKVGHDIDESILLVRISELYRFMGNYPKAEKYAIKSLKVAESTKNNLRLQSSYQHLYEIAKARNDFNSSLGYYEKYIQFRDSTFNLEKQNTIAELQIKYDTEKKEQENKILKAEAALQAIQMEQNRSITIGVIALAALLIGGVVLNSSRKHYKLKAQLAEEKELRQKEMFQAVIEAEEKERIRIAQELHDGVGQQLSGIKMAFETLTADFIKKDNTLSEKLKTLTSYLYESSDEVRNISHQMMPKSLMELGLKPALEDLLEKAFKHSPIKVSFEPFNIASRFSRHIEFTVYRVAQELINNVIKHSGANEVYVQLFADKKNLRLHVEDNGKGFNGDTLEGHGIYSMKSRLELAQGKIHFENGPVSGTVASVTVPLG